MSNNISVNNNLNNYNINTKTIKSTSANNVNPLEGLTSPNPLQALGMGGLGLEEMLGAQSGQGDQGMAQILQMSMLSKLFGGGEEGSNSGGFQMVLGALVKALNEKQQANKIGLDSNNQFSGVHINELNLRSVVAPQTVSATNENKTQGERIEAAIKAASQKHGISEELIRAIIKVESNFNPTVKSSAGAMGLMQLMPGNVKDYGVKDPYNIEENVDAGTRHIKDYLKLHNNNLDMALAAYNFGPGNMRRRGISSEADFYKLPTETKNYLVKIRKYYNP